MKLSVFYKSTLFLVGIINLVCVDHPVQAMTASDEENKATSSRGVKFAVIGDYGAENKGAQKVAELVKSWDPDFIITTGDNNYPSGEAETIDRNIGSLYSQYIFPYNGEYPQPPVNRNRFWPCIGNHDFGKNKDARPYFEYFPALNAQFYYDFIQGAIHFFSVCSDRKYPDGISPQSKQLFWLKEKVQSSQASWKIVYYHHPTYSSCATTPGWGKWPSAHLEKNDERRIDLPFFDWGVSAVLSGHLHLYERIEIEGIPYITNGLGGDESYYTFCDKHRPDPESKVRFEGENGAMLIEGNNKELSFKFMTISGKTIDNFSLKK